ncbi:uncharacterized protein TM35_000231200 [Trypanosoma theileri]|uniref:Uncharacterized protein n=1 Tax=Trypanosoma theileri TaxID=67003 RepID=A0A1X0NSI8_9TRYP|nr:uncharacterized protein TM35_000231200 [Trypanosoma theileri]ORC87149.1 hypothetical protein TM35_000231200 [Trypanosoma theileri]
MDHQTTTLHSSSLEAPSSNTAGVMAEKTSIPPAQQQQQQSSSSIIPETSTLSSEMRIEVLQRTLNLLRQEVLIPYYEPVERLRVTNNRAVCVQDLVKALDTASFDRGTIA